MSDLGYRDPMKPSLISYALSALSLTQVACNDTSLPAGDEGMGGQNSVVAGDGDGDASATDETCQERGGFDLEFSLAGFEREVRVYTPKICSPSEAPLIIGLHGQGRTYSDLLAAGIDLDGHFSESAVVALPNALPNPNGDSTWGVDMTLALFDELVERIADEAEFDRDKIFVVGSSNGAYMANTLACRRGDAIRGIAIQAGGLWSDGACVGNPAVWLSHDVGDQYVPIEQGYGLRDRWATRNGCSGEVSDSDADGCVTYEGCEQPVRFCEHSGSALDGHLWPPFATASLGAFFANLEPRENTRAALDWPEVSSDLAEEGDGGGRVLVQVTTTTESHLLSPITLPAAGATVAVETSDGALIEGETNAAGEVALSGIDFLAGPVNVTAFLVGHKVHSVVGVTDTDSGDADVALDLLALQPTWDAQVSVSGAISGKPSSTAWMRIVGNPGSEGWEGNDNQYEVQVPSGEDISLVLSHWSTPDHSQKLPNREYVAERAFNRFELGVVDADRTVDLDVSGPVIGTTRSGAFSFPQGEGAFELQTARANVVVQALTGRWAGLGGATHTVIDTSSGQVSWDAAFLEEFESTEVFTSYSLAGQRLWTFPHHPISADSGVLVVGYPGENPTPALLPSATVTQPMRGQAWPLHAPIAWQAPPNAVPHEIVLTDSAQELVWTVLIPEGVTEMTIPRPPRAVTEALDGKPVAATIRHCERDRALHPVYCTKYAQAESIFLFP